MSAVGQSAMVEPKPRCAAWEQIGNVVALLAFASTVLFTVRHHEKWADEAQAWLIARDLPLNQIWLRELQYEGSPGLWHTILWFVQRVFHAPYDAMSYMGVAFAICGIAVLLWKAPFPWYVRWPLCFTYFLVYQYAVIARPYTLLPLFCFGLAIFYKDQAHPERMTAVLALLSILSLHGSLLAASFGLLYLLNAVRSWKTLDSDVRHRYVICSIALLGIFLFLFFILKPTPDNEEFVMKHRLDLLPEAVRQQIHAVTPIKKLTTVLCGAFLDYPAPSVLFLIAVAAWSWTRKAFLMFLVPTGMMVTLYSVIHGYAHHHGTVFIASLTALWIAWPSNEEQGAFSAKQRWELRGMVSLLLVLCAINIADAAVASYREYRYPYSGAEDAARYLTSVEADRLPMFGLLYGVAGVQAYFDHNIFANIPTTYFHHALPLWGTSLDVDALNRIQPEYVVVYSVEPDLLLRVGAQELTTRGYRLAHFSDGYYLYKQSVYQREAYFIFQRIH